MADAGMMDLGAGAMGGMGGGGGGKSGGDMSGMGDMGIGGDMMGSGLGDLSSMAGGAMGFGASPTSFGGDISTTAAQQQDPTGGQGAQQSIQAAQPAPGQPGGGIGGTQTGPVSLGQGPAPATPTPPSIPKAGEGGAPVTAVPTAQQDVPTTPIPGNQAMTPQGGFSTGRMGTTFTPGSALPSGFQPTTPSWGDVANRFGSWTTDPSTGASMPSSMAAGGPDQPAAPAAPQPSPSAGVPGPGDTGFGKIMAGPGGDAGSPGPAPEDKPGSNVMAKGDKLPVGGSISPTLSDLSQQPFPNLSGAQMGDLLGTNTFPPSQQDYAPAAQQAAKDPAVTGDTKTPTEAAKPPPATAPRPAAPTARPAASRPAAPVTRDPYGNTYTTQPGYQASPMSPLPPYPGGPPAAAPAARAAAPAVSPAAQAAMNTPQGQAVQSVMNQLPIRTLLQLAQAAGVPVPPQLAMTMGGQPPPYMAPPMTPTAAAPTATSYAPTTSTPAAAPAQAAITDVTGSRPADSQPPGRAPDYFQRHGGQVGANLTRVNTPFGPVTANQQVAQDISGLTNEMKEKGVPGIKSFGSYNPRQKAYGSGWSSHAFGAAFDINDSAGPMNAQTQAWINQHPQEWQDMLARHNFTQYMPTKDPNHLEWTGPSQTAGGPPRAEDLSQLGDPSQGRGKVNVGRDQIINPSATQYRDISRAGNRADWPKFESETQPSTMVEDERDTGDSSFANRFPAWANDPNIADRLVREGQASGAGAYIPPEDQPLVAELLRQRQLLRRTGPTVR